MKREDCWMTYSEALDAYMEARGGLQHYGEGHNRRQCENDLQIAKDHMDAIAAFELERPMCKRVLNQPRKIKTMRSRIEGWIASALFVIYLIGVLVTYGHQYVNLEQSAVRDEKGEYVDIATGGKIVMSFASALGWPLYWSIIAWESYYQANLESQQQENFNHEYQ